jgi:hypothetical protein
VFSEGSAIAIHVLRRSMDSAFSSRRHLISALRTKFRLAPIPASDDVWRCATHDIQAEYRTKGDTPRECCGYHALDHAGNARCAQSLLSQTLHPGPIGMTCPGSLRFKPWA